MANDGVKINKISKNYIPSNEQNEQKNPFEAQHDVTIYYLDSKYLRSLLGLLTVIVVL